MKSRRLSIGQKSRSSDAAGTERVEKNRLEHIKLNNQYMMTTINGASRKEKIHKSQTNDSVTERLDSTLELSVWSKEKIITNKNCHCNSTFM